MAYGPRPIVALLTAAGILGASAPARANDGPIRFADTQIEPVAWSAIDGWADDDLGAAFETFLASCGPFNKRRGASRDPRPIDAALQAVCKRAAEAGKLTGEQARAFFETNFRPLRIAKLGEVTGLITGYYEPIVDGSRFPNPEFSTPLYRRPPDILYAGRKLAGVGFPNRGQVMRRNLKGELEPYHDRAAIENGALDGQRLEICWIRDPFEAMSIQIQGSARIKLEDGTILRVNYDAHNGHGYTAVGRVLIERNLVPREEMSMERIRQWMRSNPADAAEVRHTNKSFVFFRITGLSGDNEPAGAQGVPLTPQRSIAVDKNIHVYGTPFFIEADLPIESGRARNRLRRLMISQDTGSAIVGPARADFYWGAGVEAGRIAGRFRHQGKFTMLIPRALDPVEAGKEMPLPTARPADADKTPDAKPEQKPDAKPQAKPDAKAAPKSVGSGDSKNKSRAAPAKSSEPVRVRDTKEKAASRPSDSRKK